MTTLEWIVIAGFVAVCYLLYAIGCALDHISEKLSEIEEHSRNELSE